MDYKQQLDDLVAGKITEIQIDPTTFFAFNQVWKEYDKRKEIIGSAQRDGRITYRFSESDNK